MNVNVYLARVVLSPRGLSDPHDIHRLLWRAFPSESERRAGLDVSKARELASPFLFRADRVRDGADVTVRALVQAATRPDWSRVSGSILSLEEPAGGEATFTLSEGRRFAFFLRANPTQARKDRAQRVGREAATTFGELSREEYRDRRGKRVALRGDDAREAWLARKLDGAAEIPARTLLDVEGRETSARELRTSNDRAWRWRHRGATATQEGVDFQGLLTVRDPLRLATLLRDGVGPGKGLGFGLLSLKALSP